MGWLFVLTLVVGGGVVFPYLAWAFLTWLSPDSPQLTPQQRYQLDKEAFAAWDDRCRTLKAQYDRLSADIRDYKARMKALPWYVCPETLRRRYVLAEMRASRGELFEEYDIATSLRDCYRRSVEDGMRT